MTKNKRRLYRVLIAVVAAYLLVFSLSWGLGEIDYNRVNHEKSPIFCVSLGIIEDGGTEEYVGFGYRLTAYKELTILSRPPEHLYVRVGPEITYTARWLWPGLSALMRDKENTRLESMASPEE